jgi:hypothetical protein
LLASVCAIFASASLVTRFGRSEGGGSKRQTNAASEPSRSIVSRTRPALWIAASIFPRCRTIDASSRRRLTSASVKRATFVGSNRRNARRKASRFLRIVSQLRPD